jgi:hypothetical protein
MVKHLFDDGNLYGWLADGHLNDASLCGGGGSAGAAFFTRRASRTRAASRGDSSRFLCFLVILGVVQHNPTTRCRAFYPVRLGFTAKRAATLSLSV